jgi:hypothetical protein
VGDVPSWPAVIGVAISLSAAIAAYLRAQAAHRRLDDAITQHGLDAHTTPPPPAVP